MKVKDYDTGVTVNATIEIDDDRVIAYIIQRYGPSDVYSEAELISWAINNGFVREVEDE